MMPLFVVGTISFLAIFVFPYKVRKGESLEQVRNISFPRNICKGKMIPECKKKPMGIRGIIQTKFRRIHQEKGKTSHENNVSRSRADDYRIHAPR
jgi:hypothetical protein